MVSMRLTRPRTVGAALVLAASLACAAPSAAEVAASGRHTATSWGAATRLVAGDGLSDDAVISAHGRYVAYHLSNGPTGIFLEDRRTDEVTQVAVADDEAPADGESFTPAISGDGRHVAFYSYATNLVPGDHNGSPDIFVRDWSTGTTERISVGYRGQEGVFGSNSHPVLSADGDLVAFRTGSPGMVPRAVPDTGQLYLRSRAAESTRLISTSTTGEAADADVDDLFSISPGGRYVAYSSAASNLAPGDTNGVSDLFLRDRTAGTTTLLSHGVGGAPADGATLSASVSRGGRYVAFTSLATNLVEGDTNGASDVFVVDTRTGSIERASVGRTGRQKVQRSLASTGAISADGRFITFFSVARFVPGDVNGGWDVLVRDRVLGRTARASVSSDGHDANSSSWEGDISEDGRHPVFSSDASNLSEEGHGGVFVRERFDRRALSRTTVLVGD